MALSKDIRRFRKYLLIFWSVILVMVGIFFLFMILLANGFFGSLPSFEELENPKSNLATELYSADGVLLGSYYAENRSNIRYEELPEHLVHGLVATEDARYYQHSGIDEKSFARILVKSILLGDRDAGGGSTITQQLAKNLYGRQTDLSTVQLFVTKFKEWITATRLEKSYTKEEILTMYLNTVPFLYGAHGIKSASKTFFGQIPDSLKVEEASVMVAMLKNPVAYNPIRFPERSTQRRNVVMYQMMKYGYLEQETYDSLKMLPLDMSKFSRIDHNTGLATYFREQLRSWLKEWCESNTKTDGSKYNLYKDGLKVYTTIDSRMQRHAEDAVEEWMTQLQTTFFNRWKNYRYEPWTYPWNDRIDPNFVTKAMKRSDRYRSLKAQDIPEDSIEIIFKTPVQTSLFSWTAKNNLLDTLISPYDSIRYTKMILHTGFMAMDPESGYVRAWVGGINHRFFQYDHVHFGFQRQVGSTFKPFVYTAAIEQKGFSPCMEIPNIPVTFSKDDPRWDIAEDYTPKNSGGGGEDSGEGEMIALKDALAQSINYVTAYLMKEVGIQPVIDIAERMGVKSQIPYQPSICLGTPEISVYEMVSAYTTFVNKGVSTEPIFVTRIEDKNGVEIASFSAAKEKIIDEEIAYVMLDILQNVVNYGTGQRLRRAAYGGLKNQVAGKTGTTQQHSDGWFMGMVPQLVCGTWVGADDPVVAFRSIKDGQGANMALPIYGLFMQRVYQDKELGIDPNASFELPSREINIELDCSKYKQIKEDPYKDLYKEISLGR